MEARRIVQIYFFLKHLTISKHFFLIQGRLLNCNHQNLALFEFLNFMTNRNNANYLNKPEARPLEGHQEGASLSKSISRASY